MSIKIIIFSKLLNYPIIINYNVNLFNIYIKLCSATKLSYELFIVYKSTQNGSVPLVWPAKDLKKTFISFHFHIQNKLFTVGGLVSNCLSMKIFAHCREFHIGKALEGILWKSHVLKITAKSRCHLYMYNVPLCVRRDPGGAARGPGERRRGAVARPPARPRHPRHTVDPRWGLCS